jgi:hypothetical protein
MRRGEMLALRFADVDSKRQVIVLRAETTKSRRTGKYLHSFGAWKAVGLPRGNHADMHPGANRVGQEFPVRGDARRHNGVLGGRRTVGHGGDEPVYWLLRQLLSARVERGRLCVFGKLLSTG